MPVSEDTTVDDMSFDFSQVANPARIAIYDDVFSPPHVISVAPCETNQFIEDLSSTIHERSRTAGGSISYSVIRELSENFIHARFSEIVVSIFDNGNTIRFSDQGPGIRDIDRVQRPGFTSATEPMKDYIRGVGSGLPTVNAILEVTNGSISIENNVDHGTTVTVSLVKKATENGEIKSLISTLSINQTKIISEMETELPLGVSEIATRCSRPPSSVSYDLGKLIDMGLIEKSGRKYLLSSTGRLSQKMISNQ